MANRQTDHATEECVAVGEIACARLIPPNSKVNFIHGSLSQTYAYAVITTKPAETYRLVIRWLQMIHFLAAGLIL